LTYEGRKLLVQALVRFWRFPAEIAALPKQAFTVCVRLVQHSTSFRGPRFSPGSLLQSLRTSRSPHNGVKQGTRRRTESNWADLGVERLDASRAQFVIPGVDFRCARGGAAIEECQSHRNDGAAISNKV